MTLDKCPSCERMSMKSVRIDYIGRYTIVSRCIGCQYTESHSYAFTRKEGRRAVQPEGFTVTKVTDEFGSVQYAWGQ